MKNSDIATADLATLFSGLTSLAENNRRSAAGRKAKQPKRKPPSLDKRPLVFRTRWENQAVVMHTTISDCRCCGHQFTTPSPLLLRRTNTAVGTHMKEMHPGEHYPSLPHETITRYTTVEACHLCFPLCHALEAMQPSAQLSLTFTDFPEDLYLNPPPPPEGRPEFTQPRAKAFAEYVPVRGAYHRPNEPLVTPQFHPTVSPSEG